MNEERLNELEQKLTYFKKSKTLERPFVPTNEILDLIAAARERNELKADLASERECCKKEHDYAEQLRANTATPADSLTEYRDGVLEEAIGPARRAAEKGVRQVSANVKESYVMAVGDFVENAIRAMRTGQ